ncbi:MAG: bifunctional 4'-phosphopantothenoylcysteine decarboxylase/phosphopantothenoylcysteine synthetase, partial [Candidatus Omnitrophica bacterium]|nr:bifunctional 4'-phosphopantothenoylcysteine decarboxylase/phosphopantothenoylcysteine synthetase [Candidatus Omnitrophota bacterium]
MKKKNKEIIIGVTGSIAAYKACDAVSKLVQNGFSVTVVMTKEAEKFVSPLTFQTISNNPVITDLFNSPDEWSPLHISLAERAGLVIIIPATANVISKIAYGICDDALTCLVVSTTAKVILCPA